MNYAIWGTVGPATWPVWLLLIGGLLTLWRPGWLSRTSVAAGALLFVAFGLLPVGHWLMRPLETRFPPDAVEGSIRDIVVLAGAEQLRASAEAGRLEVSDAGDRVIEGAALARRLPAARLWIVGGVTADRRPVTDSGWTADAWRRLGVAPDRIVPVTGTLNTCENARALAGRLSARPLLVTSAFHMPRSVACFRRHGIEPLVYPVDYRSWRPLTAGDWLSTHVLGNLERTDLALHEWIGLAWYRLSGRTDELYPSPL